MIFWKNFLLIEIIFYMWPSVRSARLSPHRLYFKIILRGVGEQTSNGQNTAFTFSVIQLLYIFQVVHDDLIRLHHFFICLKFLLCSK